MIYINWLLSVTHSPYIAMVCMHFRYRLDWCLRSSLECLYCFQFLLQHQVDSRVGPLAASALAVGVSANRARSCLLHGILWRIRDLARTGVVSCINNVELWSAHRCAATDIYRWSTSACRSASVMCSLLNCQVDFAFGSFVPRGFACEAIAVSVCSIYTDRVTFAPFVAYERRR